MGEKARIAMVAETGIETPIWKPKEVFMNRVQTVVSDTMTGKTTCMLGGSIFHAMLTKKDVLYISLDIQGVLVGKIERAGIRTPDNFLARSFEPRSKTTNDIVKLIDELPNTFDLIAIDQVDLLADWTDTASRARKDLLLFGDTLSKKSHGAAVWLSVSRPVSARDSRTAADCNCPGAPHAPTCPA